MNQRRPFFRGENPISVWSTMTVTTFRVWATKTTPEGGELLSSVPLDKIDGVSLHSYAQQWLLVAAMFTGSFALMGVVIGLSESGRQSGDVMLVGGCTLGAFTVFLIVAYVLSRKILVTIYAGALTLDAQVSSSQADLDAARAFLHQVEESSLQFRGKV